MSDHTFRVTVRGVFAALTGAQRAALLADAADHDILRAAFTPEGDLSYDLAARDAFTFRFLATGAGESDLAGAAADAEAVATRWLTERGYGFRNLRSHAVDVTLAPLSKRQRRARAGGD